MDKASLDPIRHAGLKLSHRLLNDCFNIFQGYLQEIISDLEQGLFKYQGFYSHQ